MISMTAHSGQKENIGYYVAFDFSVPTGGKIFDYLSPFDFNMLSDPGSKRGICQSSSVNVLLLVHGPDGSPGSSARYLVFPLSVQVYRQNVKRLYPLRIWALGFRTKLHFKYASEYFAGRGTPGSVRCTYKHMFASILAYSFCVICFQREYSPI